MKTKSLMIAIALMALVMGMTAAADAVITINPVASIDPIGNLPTTTVAPNGVFYVVVQASDVTGITAAALTLTFDPTKFLVVGSRGVNNTFTASDGEMGGVNIDSQMFTSFTSGTASEIIRLANVPTDSSHAQLGKVMFAGATIDTNQTTGGNSKLTGKKNLFLVRFKAIGTGTGTFALTKTTLNNTAAGWNNEQIPPLMKAAAKNEAGWSNLTATTGGAFTAFTDAEYTLGSTNVTIGAGGNDISQQSTITLNLNAGWNMVALSVIPDSSLTGTTPNNSVKALFPEATAAYSYGTGYTNVLTGVLEAGLGYWVKVPAAKAYTITGAPLKTYSYSLQAGKWYLLAGPASATGVTPTTSPTATLTMYKYAGFYSPVTQLSQGNAYWVKANTACTFTVTVP